MKKTLISISMLALACTANANIHTTNDNIPVIKSDAKIEAKVDQTLKKLTLEEKVGQMMEIVIDLLGATTRTACSTLTSTRPTLSSHTTR